MKLINIGANLIWISALASAISFVYFDIINYSVVDSLIVNIHKLGVNALCKIVFYTGILMYLHKIPSLYEFHVERMKKSKEI